MKGCCYQRQAKCTECSFIVYRTCEKYRLWRTKWLLRPLLPMTLRVVNYPLSKNICYFTRSEDVAKQQAAQAALKLQLPIVKYSQNQAISIILDGGEVEEKIVYIECKKASPDNQKVQSVFESFVDRMLLQGKIVIIFAVANTISMNDSWSKITVKSEEC